jgi:hypothetical protein
MVKSPSFGGVGEAFKNTYYEKQPKKQELPEIAGF